MSPGAACGDPRAAPGYMEARRRAPGEAPGCGGNRAFVPVLALPNKLKPQKLVFLGFRALGVAGVVFRVLGLKGVVFGPQQAGRKVLRSGYVAQRPAVCMCICICICICAVCCYLGAICCYFVPIWLLFGVMLLLFGCYLM